MIVVPFELLAGYPLSACRAGVFWLVLLPIVSLFGDCLPAGGQSSEVEPLSISSLPNAHRLHARVIAGGQPDGESGFQTLSSLGVRTVISVDGAKPDGSLAQKYGIRYVHLPHGYDGIPKERILQLAKAVSELPGPVYIHCHHGKHRSPAAAAVACVAAGYLSREAGREVLSRMGTSRDYIGLHESVATATLIDDLKDQQVEFRQSADVPPIQSAMVALERRFDVLAELERAGWKSPPGNPDLAPPHQALLLREQLTELSRAEHGRAWPADFFAIIEHSRVASASLEEELRHPDAAGMVAQHDRLSATLAEIKKDCRGCHQKYRDQPLGRVGGGVSLSPFDHCLFDALPGLDSGKIERFKDALFGMKWDVPEHRRLLELEGLKQWMPPRESGYESLAAALPVPTP